MLEWCLLALVVLGFVGVFGHYAKRVHSQAERAAVLTTLGALRTAMVLEHLQTAMGDASAKVLLQSDNPFDALEQYPASYAGQVKGRDVGAVVPGQWVFDAQCGCIGYKPLYLDWLESREHLDTLWFQRRKGGSASLLVPLDRYVWHDQLVE
jgi:hypothetical protein